MSLSADRFLLRIGLASAGGLLLFASYSQTLSRAPFIGQPVFALSIVVLSGLALLLIGLAALGKLHPRARWLVLLACLLELFVRSALTVANADQAALVTSQAGFHTEVAAQLLVRGQNPYAYDFRDVADLYGAGTASAAPRAAFGSPALPALFAMPLAGAGLPAAYTLSVLLYALLLIVIFVAVPRTLQPVALLPLIVGDRLLFTTLAQADAPDLLWSLLLVGVIACWHRPRAAAALTGLAFASSVVTWVLLPFLLVRLWHEQTGMSRRPAVLRFAAISIGVFVAVNLPFIVADLSGWTSSLLKFTAQTADGLGVSALNLYGLLALPPAVYALASVSVLGLFVFWAVRAPGVFQHFMWVMPGLAAWLWFSSPVPVWMFTLPPALLSVLTAASTPAAQQETSRLRGVRAPLLATAAVLIALMLAVVVTGSQGHLQVSAHIVYPLRTDVYGRIAQMTVHVTNTGAAAIRPVFAVTSVSEALPQPLPWDSADGPEMLAAGESAIYRIAARRSDGRFYTLGQVTLQDRDTGHTARIVVGPYNDYSFPDAIFNADFQRWAIDGAAPIGWGLVGQPAQMPEAMYEVVDGRDALTLRFDSSSPTLNTIALQTALLFPEQPLTAWLYRPRRSESGESEVLYGLDFQIDQRRVLLLASEAAEPPTVSPQLYVGHIAMEAETWTAVTVDLNAIFAEAGWDRPVLERALFRELETDLSVIRLRLLLAVRGARGLMAARFGPIEQTSPYVPPQRLMREIFDHPRDYYVRLAETHVIMRNYERAYVALERALGFAPGDADVIARMNAVQHQLTELAAQHTLP